MALMTAVLPLAGEWRPDQTPAGLEQALQDLPGVRDVAIEPFGEVIKVVYDDERVALEDILIVLAQHDYPVGAPIAVHEGAT